LPLWPSRWSTRTAPEPAEGSIEAVIARLAELPPGLIYVVIAAGAAVENIVPPVPADTFVLLGAFLAAAGRASPWLVFLLTWTFNVAGALSVYAAAWHFGGGFFESGAGRFLLHPGQIRQIGRFYHRWGTSAMFTSRFLPAFRAMVPVFAGMTRMPPGQVVAPLALASGIWYGCLVWIGAAAGRNWEAILEQFGRISRGLAIVAIAVAAGIGVWWWRTRHRAPS
jgi:membrane-associated protein